MEVSVLIEKLLNDEKEVNLVIDIQEIFLRSETTESVTEIIKGLNKFFKNIFEAKKILYEKKQPESSNAEETLKSWMREQYADYCKEMLNKLSIDNDEIKECIQTSLFEMIKYEVMYHTRSEMYFPIDTFVNLLSECLKSENFEGIIDSLMEFMSYDDFRHFTFAAVKKILNKNRTPDVEYLMNVFELLSFVSKFMPKFKDNKRQLIMTLDNSIRDEPVNYKQLQLKEHQKKFEEAWLCLLKHNLNAAIIRKVLIAMSSLIIPHFNSPCLLADFLSLAYSQGGGISVLALHGLFNLMIEHNLEYPDFYKKLYTLVHPRVFSAKYAPRFFHLLNIFLSSSHLPAYMVAAFTKKLCRIMLSAPTNILSMLIVFVINLLKRFDFNRLLVDRPLDKIQTELQRDPFIETEDDPMKCYALDSSLWELTVMMKHYDPNISTLASIKSLPFKEVDIDELLEISSYEFFDKSMPEQFDAAPLNVEKPTKLFGGEEDSFSEIWCL